MSEAGARRHRGGGLVDAYDRVLEQQILGRGSCLACRDETLRTQVDGLLEDADPREVHCLGLDPLGAMEEALMAAPSVAYGRRGGAGRGLRGLAKAFEVLEQAALNLYLGPWREEYKVIKMYSGTFTHFIAPVLPLALAERLFGLLGYRPGPARPEQLRLQSARVSPASLEDLLRLSCAFFLARCECRLLLRALGGRGGDGQWELSLVRERQRGLRLQVAVDNVGLQLAAEAEVDLYREEEEEPGSEEEEEEEEEEPGGRRSDVRCRCLAAPPLRLQRCFDCNAFHSITCADLAECNVSHHRVEDASGGEGEESRCEGPGRRPISYHCESAKADPQLLCRSCNVLHGAACVEGKLCRTTHETSALGRCSCGRPSSRNPLVLCHYCGNEYCSRCWYQNPLSCTCGQTFDPSTSV
uniref:Spermatogenesis associated 2 like n=1 Tax=Fundulus heteroclitus TaxID=8078 RepID=A0A3Q2QI93_FUNHE